MIDPPWPMLKGGLRRVRPAQTRAFPYNTLTLDQIFDLLDHQIWPQATQCHTVFMWANECYLQDCEAQLHLRGYKRHARIIWDKMNGIAPAFTIRFCHEYLLWYYKPMLLPVATAVRGHFKTVFAEKAREHSRKPEFAYTLIASLYPSARKIDVFSRQQRPGWAQFGDQIDFFYSLL